MQIKVIIVVIFFLLVGKVFSINTPTVFTNLKLDSILIAEEKAEVAFNLRPNPILQLFKAKQKKNKKLIAAALAFPLPFGIVGLHRIYLGTAPYVPVVYIGTIGGGFGILPFIDFCILILDKDFERYNNNNKVFMWVNDEQKKHAK
jgi:TM2 domain-containing membrane protein YozV